MLLTTAIFWAVFLVLQFTIQNFRVDGSSMHPTLVDTQHLIASKVAYLRVHPTALLGMFSIRKAEDRDTSLFTSPPPAYGEVVAFAYPVDPSQDLVKRVIGLPGDVIEIQEGYVVRNGQRLPETYVFNRDRRTISEVTVPSDSYYVLGDNRRRSTDSRDWGFVPGGHIIGRVWFSYWPSHRVEFIHPLW